MMESIELDIWQQQQDYMAASFNVMRATQVLTDVTIVCDGAELPAHRSLLSAASPFFRAMFKSECKEALTGKVELPTIALPTAQMVLDFIYTGKIPNILNDRDQLKYLLEASRLLQLNLLFQYCLQQLSAYLSTSYFLELCELAILHDAAELQLKIPSFIAQNFFEVSCSAEFLNMDFSQLSQVLQDQQIKGCATDIILKGIITWAKFNAKDRSCRLDQLLQFIDIKRASTDLLQIYAKDPVIVSNLLASNIVREELTERLEGKACEPKILCFGWDEDEDYAYAIQRRVIEKRVMTIYYVNKMTWSDPVTVSTELKIDGNEAVVAFNEDVYFLGGKDSHYNPSATVYKYSPVANIVIRLNDLKIPVSNAGAAVLDSCIYVVGGEFFDMSLKIVHRFNTCKGTTEVLSSNSFAHYDPIVFAFQKYVYVVGSDSYGSNQGALEKYDPVADQWTVISEIPGTIQSCCGGIRGGKLFIFPCRYRAYDKKLYIYDLVSDKWEVKCKEDGPTSVWCMFVTSASSIFTSDDHDIVHIYNIPNGNWHKVEEKIKTPWRLSVFLE